MSDDYIIDFNFLPYFEPEISTPTVKLLQNFLKFVKMCKYVCVCVW